MSFRKYTRVLSEKVEPHLGQGRITILDHYPAAEAALDAAKAQYRSTVLGALVDVRVKFDKARQVNSLAWGLPKRPTVSR